MADYDIGAAFEAIENELIESMIRNMKRHRVEEIEEGFEWDQWQALQLEALDEFRRSNPSKFRKRFHKANREMEKAIKAARKNGQTHAEAEILEAIKKGYTKQRRAPKGVSGAFFKTNDRKLNALIKATKNDFQRGEIAILRRANDQYRKAIYNAQVYANTGAGTYEKAVDMATRDMRAAGLKCIEYKNGARHTLESYARMAIRTANTRAYLMGEAEKREEWGIHTVIVNKRTSACPKCAPFCGRILIDDVYGSGKASEGPYPLLSSAIAAGLYHPNCKDVHTTYFEGVSDEPNQKWTKAEIEELLRKDKLNTEKEYANRQKKKYERLANTSLDPENKKKYEARAEQWEEKVEELTPAEKHLLRNNIPHGFRDTREVGEPISEERLTTIIEKAQSKGIRIGANPSSRGNFELYCGDPNVLEDIIDRLGDSLAEAKNAGLLKPDAGIILQYDNVLGYLGDNSAVDIGAFAETKGKTITLNKFMFDDTSYLKEQYLEVVENGVFAKGTDHRNIVDHEMGHIIDKENKGLRKRILNLLQKEATNANMSLDKYIVEHISAYALFVDKNGEIMYDELIPEIYSLMNGSEARGAKELFRKAGVKV